MALSGAWDRARNNSNNHLIPWKHLEESSIVVTGSTGLIGSQFVRSILQYTHYNDANIRLILPVRNLEKAKSLFGEQPNIKYVSWVMGEAFPDLVEGDYFVHAACPTSSDAFLHRPVEIISDIFKSTEAVVELLKTKKFKSCIYLSTMEVYGDIEGKAVESKNGSIDTMNPRSSYPEAKRLSECMFASAAAEYDLHICVLRLAQTFGIGVPEYDGRVFAEFGRCILDGKDIVLYSDGAKRNPYLSVDDAVSAIVYLMAFGKAGEAYNAANPSTYCSVLEMAQMLISEFGNDGIDLVFGSDVERSKSFRQGNVLNLDCSKLLNLGWIPVDSLKDMYLSMFSGWMEHV